METLHNSPFPIRPSTLFISFVLHILFSSSHYMQIKWRWKCDINDNRHWNETVREWELFKLKCDVKIAMEKARMREMWHENYWENSHCLSTWLFTRLSQLSFLDTIKYLQFAFIVELIVKWKFLISEAWFCCRMGFGKSFFFDVSAFLELN